MSILGLGCTMILATVFCLRLMRESLAGVPESVSLIPLILCILGFFVCAVCLALFQGLRYSNRIVGPTQRLCSILRLVRKGDLTVRAHLRRGDYLTELAQELNSLIDWLNENPPPGAKTGGDLVHVEEEGPEFDDAEFLPLIGQEKD